MLELVNSIQKAIDYIEDRLLTELDYSEIAKQAYMSSFVFQRVFSAVCNITLGEYIRNRRLSLSKDELLSSSCRIIDIALKYQYNSPEGYTRAFYRYYGMTPSVARNRREKLSSFEKIFVKNLIKGEKTIMNDLSQRKYTVKNSGAIYYTNNMDETTKWFKDILGWYAGIDARDENGYGIYGCALPFPGELVNMKIAEFNGFHFFPGQPEEREMLFINIEGIDNLYDFVKANGWDEITQPQNQLWGGRTCRVTTIDNSIIIFCESI